MATTKRNPISQQDILDWLASSSNFAFELRCVKLLNDNGVRCLHGGSYSDPVTKKTRQFDIRAQWSSGRIHARFAVECKNLDPTFPLLVQCVPRTPSEAFHELVLSYDPSLNPETASQARAFQKTCETIRLSHPNSVYEEHAPVGKSCVQVGRSLDGSLSSNDSEVFDKWAQALASSQDLIDSSTTDGPDIRNACISLVVPVVVVPDDMLWQVVFDSTGNQQSQPTQTDRCPFFVGQGYSASGAFDRTWITLSHLEFVTTRGLKQLALDVCYGRWFPTLPEQYKD